REDLFYRLSTVPISLPPLRKRGNDIHLLFRKFASDFGDKYRMPAIKLSDDAVQMLVNYSWPGNIRQLKNLVEQISVIETAREIDSIILSNYLPVERGNSPAVINKESNDSINERELMYKFLFDMKKDLTELKKLVLDVLPKDGSVDLNKDQVNIVNRLYQDLESPSVTPRVLPSPIQESYDYSHDSHEDSYEAHEEVEESLSLEDREKELIQKALQKHKGKRKYAASELGISERTLYRKIKEYNLNE
ncbi:MAG: sigma-54-dependent Fis family transcriptional regulator, partial [Flavobacteriales bacterium]|nr:sigma-54-dependent Fis family transcriptional regulator [Flavobacteriales bacterium]